MTGRRSDDDRAPVQTFRNRQSSLVGGALGPPPCMHRGPNWSALRTPSQRGAGCGVRQRSSPTGAAAKGTPLKTRISGLLPEVPEINPVSTRTVSEIVAAAALVEPCALT